MQQQHQTEVDQKFTLLFRTNKCAVCGRTVPHPIVIRQDDIHSRSILIISMVDAFQIKLILCVYLSSSPVDTVADHLASSLLKREEGKTQETYN